MLGDRTKSTAPKTTAHDVDAEANHLPRRNFGGAIVAAILIGISGMWTACVGQIKHMVHLSGGERNGRRVDPHIACGVALAMRLHQTACVAGVGFQMQHAVGVGVQHRV